MHFAFTRYLSYRVLIASRCFGDITCAIGVEFLDPTLFDASGEVLIAQIMNCYKTAQKTYQDPQWSLKVTEQMARFAEVFGEDVQTTNETFSYFV